MMKHAGIPIRSLLLCLPALAPARYVLAIFIAVCCIYAESEESASPATKDKECIRSCQYGGISFVWVPSGEFIQGGSSGNGALPKRRVGIAKGFWMSRYEISQNQWQTMMKQNPSSFIGVDLPVETVSWFDCVEYCKRMTSKHKRTFRLPTEAEWEYACYIDIGRCIEEGAGNLYEYCIYKENSSGKTHSVGTGKSGALGLYDILGNVAEWCSDTYRHYESNKGIYIDPVAEDGFLGRCIRSKVARGGNYLSSDKECSYFYRNYFRPKGSGSFVGLRIVLEE